MEIIRFKLFLRFLKFILPYRRQWLALLVLSGLSMLPSLINPYLAKLVVDDALISKNLGVFIILAVLGGGIFILGWLVDSLYQLIDRRIKLKVKFNLDKKVFKQMQKFSFGWFQDKSTGEHIYKISYDIDQVRDLITTIPPNAVFLFPKLLFILAIAFYLNWKLAVFSLCLAPFLYLPPYFFTYKMRQVWESLIKNSQQIFVNLQDTFSHIRLVKVFGREAASVRAYLKQLINHLRLETQNIKLQIFNSFALRGISKVIISLITFYGGYQVIQGELTLGSLAAIMIYLRQLMELQAHLVHFLQSCALGLVSCQRIAEILDAQVPAAESPKAKSRLFTRPGISFDKVSFGYRPQEQLLNKMSFYIQGGSHIALVGPSGCGKTTILYLILRLYDPGQGDIFIEGINVKDIKLKSLKEQIGVALQEPFLWNDSVENNIRYGWPNATPAAILRAAQIAGVDEFVKSLPLGYKTIIGENACKLSEGQKQKVAIARALIKDPRILILDEAMASMDSASEKNILLNIKENHKNLTLITVSHRLSTVMSADLVYLFLSPNEMLADNIQNLFEKNKSFYKLFIGQKYT